MATQSQTSNSFSATGEGTRLEQVKHAVTHPVETSPLSTSLLVFGAGLGIGALLGSMIADGLTAPTRRSQAEQLGASILASLASSMPDSVRRHLG